jgi:hypothetical protein
VDNTKIVSYVIRWATFVTYAIAAMSVLGVATNKGSCHVQSTYRQEFLVNIVSNPFMSSSSVLLGPTPSRLEAEYMNVTSQNQTAGDVAMFPVVIHDAPKHAAFHAVQRAPLVHTAGGELMLPRPRDPNALYIDDIMGSVPLHSMPAQMQALMMATAPGKNTISPGTLLPNYARCIQGFYPDNEEGAKDAAKLTDRLQKNSHLRGTCLFTGQQAMVDISSNYHTSMVLFSSVNVMFMTALVLWISASFSLFHLGGLLKSTKQDLDDAGDYFLEPDKCCKCSFITIDDLFMFLAITWNTLPVIFICSNEFRRVNNIPLNNAVLGIFALVASIAVQWGWANFKIFNAQAHDDAAQKALEKWENSNVPTGVPVAEMGKPKAGADLVFLQPHAAGDVRPGTKAPTNVFDSFLTDGFLATASAMRGIGSAYPHSTFEAQALHGTHHQAHFGNLRQRNPVSRAMHGYTQSKQRIASMPHYAAMVKLGAPIVQYNYVKHLKVNHALQQTSFTDALLTMSVTDIFARVSQMQKEMLTDSVQSLEYTITNPILLATILAAASPTVPTSMVQYAYGCLLASHILCMPIMYLGHMIAQHESKNSEKYWWTPAKIGMGLLLFSCAAYQATALYIKLYYIQSAQVFYSLNGGVSSAVILMVISQIVFVVAVLIVVILNVCKSQYEYLETSSYYIYVSLNFVTKAIAVPMLVMAANEKKFPVFTCSVWRGFVDPVTQM